MARRPELSDKEMARWKDRLDAANRLWKRHGMTGDSVGVHMSPFRYIDMYRGDHWTTYGWAGIDADDLVTVNMVFSNTNQLMARLSKKNPDPVVTARRRTQENESKARIRQSILSYFMYELKMKRQVDLALRDALLGPFGIVRHGYTPPEEKYKNGKMLDTYAFARPDAPWIKRIPFWDFRCDPNADSFHPDGTAKWCAFRDLIPIENFRDNPSLVRRDDLRPTVSGERAKIAGLDNRSTQNADWDGLVEVWWVWDKVERKRFAISPGSEQEVSPVVDWPVMYEDLPYDILMFNEQMDTNIPVPYPASYEMQQYELNKTRTLMSQLVKGLRRLVMVNSDAFSDETREVILKGDLGLTEILECRGEIQNALGQVGLGGFPSDLLGYEATIKTDIREAIGLSNMDRAQRVNVETATEAGGIQQGSEVIAGRNEEAFEQFWSDILRHFNQSLDFTLQPGMLIPIIGEDDMRALQSADTEMVEDGSINLKDPSEIYGEYDVKIRARSTLPEDKDRDLAKMLQLKKIFENDPTVKVAEMNSMMLELAGFDSSRFVATPEEQQQIFSQLEDQGVLNAKPQGGGGGGIDANTLRLLERR